MKWLGKLNLATGQDDCQTPLYLIRIETIYFPGYGTKIPNHNTQISNNIKITKYNDQNITTTYRMSRDILSVLNLEFRSLVFV